MQWNPWHGCRKYSEGCLHCYVYRTDALYGRDSSRVVQTAEFDKPLRRKRDGKFLLAGDEPVFTCFSSDFFLEEADVWRPAAWRMIRARPELSFFIVTKRILRFSEGLPADWGDGYENVTLCCTVENRRRAAERLPHFLSLPIRHKQIICEPLLERISLSPYLGRRLSGCSSAGESRAGGAGVRLRLGARPARTVPRAGRAVLLPADRAPASERTAAFMRWNGASSTGRRKKRISI